MVIVQRHLSARLETFVKKIFVLLVLKIVTGTKWELRSQAGEIVTLFAMEQVNLLVKYISKKWGFLGRILKTILFLSFSSVNKF